MAVQTRAIKRRIKSVKNTRKITKAMELVAASKMRKAVSAVLASRPYAKLAWNTVQSIGRLSDTSLHPLLRHHRETTSVLMLLITSDRGLAGGYNTNVLRRTREAIKSLGGGVQVQAVCIGKRGADTLKRLGIPILASFVDITSNPKFEEILPIGRMAVDDYTKGSFDKVVLAYTDFVSAVSQTPVVLDFLPLSIETVKSVGQAKQAGHEEVKFTKASEYTFEPSPREVLDRILPRLVQTMVYQAVLESAASEHSARMMAMRSASDAAGEMIDDLTFTFNQARQAGITQEIAEISSGKAALEN
ncbi:ATP synthase F1 subunit gamma [Patescibacteria group bacterium]|nr:MAG: ATP synthase F1 subunit gamma [Patescibacteria group bacterium]